VIVEAPVARARPHPEAAEEASQVAAVSPVAVEVEVEVEAVEGKESRMPTFHI